MSQEGDQFEVDKKVVMMSELVKVMLGGSEEEENKSTGSSEGDNEIPLPNVKTNVLAKVIEFCKHHVDKPMADIEKPLKDNDMKNVVEAWDAEFVEVDQELLFELILAANYMDIKPLLDLTCAKVASMIKGKTPDEIRKTFNITEDFTPEEEIKVRADNPWLEEC